ncbi:uncharacterized protein LOC106155627 [Lingula anatina]|uniref:Uncharacterized protein LOC106155627 n=1 Tax=Lingula anatina TaxID=7574 RepID=A0A1S3HIQ4_LINAN|nr:uncharacterized protein LOC106155627 [Lingula anatina]|eukprot:XP_013385988.1 uncharacterized protein LOC106155627 [Lingula anatina]
MKFKMAFRNNRKKLGDMSRWIPIILSMPLMAATIIDTKEPEQIVSLSWSRPGGISVSSALNRLYVVDTGNSAVLYWDLDLKRATTVLGGSGKKGFLNGPCTEAKLQRPIDLTVTRDPSVVYITDDNIIRKIDGVSEKDCEISSFAGERRTKGGIEPIDGPLSAASFGDIEYMTYSFSEHALYLLDNKTVRRLDINAKQVETLLVNDNTGQPVLGVIAFAIAELKPTKYAVYETTQGLLRPVEDVYIVQPVIPYINSTNMTSPNYPVALSQYGGYLFAYDLSDNTIKVTKLINSSEQIETIANLEDFIVLRLAFMSTEHGCSLFASDFKRPTIIKIAIPDTICPKSPSSESMVMSNDGYVTYVLRFIVSGVFAGVFLVICVVVIAVRKGMSKTRSAEDPNNADDNMQKDGLMPAEEDKGTERETDQEKHPKPARNTSNIAKRDISLPVGEPKPFYARKRSSEFLVDQDETDSQDYFDMSGEDFRLSATSIVRECSFWVDPELLICKDAVPSQPPPPATGVRASTDLRTSLRQGIHTPKEREKSTGPKCGGPGIYVNVPQSPPVRPPHPAPRPSKLLKGK